MSYVPFVERMLYQIVVGTARGSNNPLGITNLMSMSPIHYRDLYPEDKF